MKQIIVLILCLWTTVIMADNGIHVKENQFVNVYDIDEMVYFNEIIVRGFVLKTNYEDKLWTLRNRGKGGVLQSSKILRSVRKITFLVKDVLKGEAFIKDMTVGFKNGMPVVEFYRYYPCIDKKNCKISHEPIDMEIEKPDYLVFVELDQDDDLYRLMDQKHFFRIMKSTSNRKLNNSEDRSSAGNENLEVNEILIPSGMIYAEGGDFKQENMESNAIDIKLKLPVNVLFPEIEKLKSKNKNPLEK